MLIRKGVLVLKVKFHASASSISYCQKRHTGTRRALCESCSANWNPKGNRDPRGNIGIGELLSQTRINTAICTKKSLLSDWIWGVRGRQVLLGLNLWDALILGHGDGFALFAVESAGALEA